MFTFGNASEVREMIDELNNQKLLPEDVIEKGGVGVLLSDDGVEKLINEDDGNLGEEIESSLTVVVSNADQNPQLLTSEDESSVVPESETPVINDLQKYDSVEDGNDGYHAICSKDVAEPNCFPIVSKEDSRVDSLDEVGVLIVSPTEEDVVSDLSSGGSLEVEEKGIRLTLKLLISLQFTMVLRETATEQLEETQSDWAYSKPVQILYIIWNLLFIFVVVTAIVLQGVVHTVCVSFEYWRRIWMGVTNMRIL